ncbi:UDP-N-acetylmuramoyl-tripeptide--D-alanyl-D-alanine ligase [Paenibacillus sp. MER TA 81-3]|uniref:UDP-N-acetylmuramoyl-tripeptide--D-alanyl-D- alanine ligase n=1 Tax=Paenibacillus sp. MER TA 81-3 TaxID=2939573 RepID=UPI00203CA091|nr:UDP-N-acetylmuramoyl-tripeptide--D-alanyl-D-alanine ligase [Paenibacillus sp. MER TA 81-3]MCM3337080.1 UDP-N-acetylmuramoyl-tripeptide--D-alanyl-D-alanine ligase [Paenibacillus sp. MER TA 81-3]
MIETTLQEVASLCGGTLPVPACGEHIIKGVSTNSRSIRPGALFVPLRGERFDGHIYVEQALKGGAAATLWQADQPNPPAAAVIVDDTYAALQRLASAYLSKLNAKVVAVTGSNGKTTTKDLIASVLSERFKVHKTDGNFNNHIGLPLTVLSMPQDTDIAVLEMGMSGRREIELLSNIAQPDAAVITNIGEAHLLQLGSREEIARAKLEILSGLQEDGVLICHGDEPLIDLVLSEPETRHPERMHLLRFGTSSRCDIRPEQVTMLHDSTLFTVALSDGSGMTSYKLPLLGRHNVINALAAIAIGRHFGLHEEQIAHGLAVAQVSGMRFERTVTADGWTILNDAYNASPTATLAALSVLAELKGGKRIAILGDMLELGTQEVQLHYEVGASIAPGSIDLLLTYGALGQEIANGALQHFPAEAVYSFDDKEALKACLVKHAAAGDIVLVKASRGMKLEEVVNEWINVEH